MALIVPTLDEMKLALRLDSEAGDLLDAELTRHAAAALERANKQAPGAPPNTAKEAMLAYIGYLHDGGTRFHDGRDANIWRLSGAQAMLGPWTVRRAGIIKKADD
ncbi:MAG: phage gp6-like head-tail connector protein [Gemmatimonadales bacterium]|nr:phage gp6-like head-tail connector protein [Gemmatimonadales bacterium]